MNSVPSEILRIFHFVRTVQNTFRATLCNRSEWNGFVTKFVGIMCKFVHTKTSHPIEEADITIFELFYKHILQLGGYVIPLPGLSERPSSHDPAPGRAYGKHGFILSP